MPSATAGTPSVAPSPLSVVSGAGVFALDPPPPTWPLQAANEKTIASTKSRETISFAFFISISTFLINLFAFSIKREAPSDTKFGVPSGSAKQIYILGAVFLPAFQRSLYGVYQRSRFVLFKMEHYLIHF